MPYEQYMGQATASSDLYSLAATFLHLLTGRAPRDFMSGEGRIQVPDALPGDPRLRPLLVNLLNPSPAERYTSARDVRQALLASSSASVPVYRASARTAVRGAVDLSSLGPVPRPLDRTAAAIMERVTPRMLEYLDSWAKPADRPGVPDWVALIFWSVLTAGMLPLVFSSMARVRRRRMRRFFRDGIPAAAVVHSISEEAIPFEQKIAKVGYTFEADGDSHNDVDQVLPIIARRWRPGDRVQVLYLPDAEYDSVIIAAR